MDINSIKNIKPSSNLPKKLFAVVFSISIVIASFAFLNNVNNAAKEVVEIIVVKPSGGISANTFITKDILAKGTVMKADFRDGMITYDKHDDILNKYSAYFLRYQTPMYYDQLTDTKPMKNEWLYSLPKASEVLTIPYDYIECGGDILTPGDYIKVRASYEDKVPMANAGQNPYDTSSSYTTEVKTDVLFDRILVKDLLNSKGHSIYEVYKEVLKLSQEKRQSAMTNKEFMQSILAKSLVLEALPEQVDNYAKYNQKKCTFTFTILSRDGNKDILEQLPTVEKEVETWISEKKQ